MEPFSGFAFRLGLWVLLSFLYGTVTINFAFLILPLISWLIMVLMQAAQKII
jgi:hypothetical protein